MQSSWHFSLDLLERVGEPAKLLPCKPSRSLKMMAGAPVYFSLSHGLKQARSRGPHRNFGAEFAASRWMPEPLASNQLRKLTSGGTLCAGIKLMEACEVKCFA